MNIAVPVPETIYSFRCMISWQLLSGAAGVVNGFAFLVCREFVTHMTGTVTRVGLEWQATSLMFEYIFIVTSFVVGAAIAAAAIHVRSPWGERAPWVVPLSLVTLILCLVSISGYAGAFGSISSMASHESTAVFLLSLLAFGMGIQNAAIHSESGLGVRTTHLSGHATNLGIQLATVCFSQGEKRQAALRGVFLRGGKIVSFAIGAAVAIPLTSRVGFLSLLASAVCVFSAILLSQSPEGR